MKIAIKLIFFTNKCFFKGIDCSYILELVTVNLQKLLWIIGFLKNEKKNQSLSKEFKNNVKKLHFSSTAFHLL